MSPTAVRKSRISLLAVAIVAVPLLLAGQKQRQPPSPAHNPLEGAEIFRHYCASCHGADGRGHGPASVALKNAVPDLTLLSKRNSGTFPMQRVKEVIEGNTPVPPAHGDREMPIWGPIFHEVESDQDLGEVRLDNIAKYLELIQQK